MMNLLFSFTTATFLLLGYLLGGFYWQVAFAETVVEYKAEIVVVTKDPPHELIRAQVSAYTSSPDETDATPNINAAGSKPGPGSIACPPRYKFGTKVLLNNKEYVCDDRMNQRYASGDYFDIWMYTKRDAIHWGRRTITVQVLQYE